MRNLAGSVCGIFAPYAERTPRRGTENGTIRLNLIPVFLPVLDCIVYSFTLR